jgi:hypothetical protein
MSEKKHTLASHRLGLLLCQVLALVAGSRCHRWWKIGDVTKEIKPVRKKMISLVKIINERKKDHTLAQTTLVVVWAYFHATSSNWWQMDDIVTKDKNL